MKDGCKKILKCFNIKFATPWLALAIGIIFGVIAFQEYILISSNIRDLFKWIAATLLSGVIIGFMTTFAQFRGLFKNELEDVIYKYDFLKKRTDIVDIWDSVSKVLFDSKFPEISESLLTIIRDKYLPVEHVNYCKDNDTMITIRWHDKKARLIEVIQEDAFDIVTSSKDSFGFPGVFTIDVNPLYSDIDSENFDDVYREKEIDCTIDMNECKVNGEDFQCVKRNELKNGTVICTLDMTLEGSECYSLKRKMTKIYSLEYDYTIGFRAKTILNNSRVRVFNDMYEDLEIAFVTRGTLNDFKKIKKRSDYLEYEYKGLILQKQGYVLVLKCKEILQTDNNQKQEEV